MQVEKFYKAEGLRKEILELQGAIDIPFEIKAFDKLNIDTKKFLNEKVAELVKREIAKIIKQKEKEFSDL